VRKKKFRHYGGFIKEKEKFNVRLIWSKLCEIKFCNIPVPCTGTVFKKVLLSIFFSLYLEYKKETIYYDMMYDCRRCMKTSVNRLETLTETLGKKLCFIFILHFEKFPYFFLFFETLLCTGILYRTICKKDCKYGSGFCWFNV
jgi:hypothetical protein